MRIESYFQRLQNNIQSYAIVESFNIAFDKRGTHEGFIRGEIYFRDASVLHIREFVEVEITVERLMYVYHYLDSSKNLVFRYDDTGHHKELGLSTYPHHKHDGIEKKIIASSAPDMEEVLNEIEMLLPLQ